jgi:type II secretory pathway pseudopilin PulG
MQEIIIDIIPIVISIIALISSVLIGRKQVQISKQQTDAQNKVELYLLSQPITLRSAKGDAPDQVFPAILIRNIGANVVYLENYNFNGREFPLGKEVLPPVSSYDGFRYIYLPTDGTNHVSLKINFLDWQNQKWQTTGYADFKDRAWEVTYSPCEKRTEK